MKTLILTLALFISFNVFAQNKSKSKTPFLRVFNLDGKKIAKGRLVHIADSTLSIKKNRKTVEIPFKDIATIKTKHSLGNNFLVGAAVGAGTLGILGAATSSNDGFVQYSGSQGFGSGVLIGAPLGAVAGGVLGLFKNSNTFEINGDEAQWNAFKALFVK